MRGIGLGYPLSRRLARLGEDEILTFTIPGEGGKFVCGAAGRTEC